MPSLVAERLNQLPLRPTETWQGGLVRLPGWVEEPGKKPFRPTTPLWVSLQRNVIGPPRVQEPSGEPFAEALHALVDFALDRALMGCRPGKIEVNNAALADYLSVALSDTGIQVSHRDALRGLQHVVDDMTAQMASEGRVEGALSVRGVTLERVRAFADAAAAFYRAAPWQHLIDEDLVVVESPQPDTGLGCLAVLGAGGRSYGLGFYASAKAYRSLAAGGNPLDLIAEGGLWSANFGDITELPLDDSDLWLDHDLPVACDEAYPSAVCYQARGRVRRPTPRVWSYLEGLFRVLAGATEEQIDGGRWTATVATFDGPITYTLALPDLLDPPTPQEQFKRGIMPDRRVVERTNAQIERYLDQHPPADLEEANRVVKEKFVGRRAGEVSVPFRNALEEAQDLCYQAAEVRGRHQHQLIRKALAVSPDCADAYVLWAERTSDPHKAAELFALGVEAGRRTLGPKTFEDHAGHFWGRIATRPYMRALAGLAGCFERLGREEEAIGHYRELLQLNPHDNQGLRVPLLSLLLELKRDDEAAALWRQFKNDTSAIWLYGKALLEFRRSGDSPAARKALQRAVKHNPYLPDELLDDEESPIALPDAYKPGSEEEAALFADHLREAWETTDGAMEWLESRT